MAVFVNFGSGRKVANSAGIIGYDCGSLAYKRRFSELGDNLLPLCLQNYRT